jgi:glycosyltransferase involved in cell wall biosynthesis
VNGHRLQLIHLTRELARSHEVCALAFKTPDQEADPPAGVELVTVPRPSSTTAARAAAFPQALTRREPVRATRLGQPMRRAAEQILARRSFDVAHVSHGSLAAVGGVLGSTPGVLAPRDAWHLHLRADALVAPQPLRPLLRMEERRVRRFGTHAYRGFRRVVFVTDEDARASRELDPSLAVDVIPNGVDVEEFTVDRGVETDDGLLVFTGAMHWSPNVKATELLAREVLPRVRRERADARLSIVGRGPREDVLALARLEGVEVTGEVPDVRPWLRRAHVYVCPMVSGTGIKNKLLEAMACGSACVASPLATQGMTVRDGRELLVADGPDATSRAVLRLMEEPALAARLAEAARSYVVSRHSWAAVARDFERVYRDAGASA